MTLEELCDGLLDALEAFDTQILPLGLYASDEIQNAQGRRAQNLGQYQEWPRAIVPYLQSVRDRGQLGQLSDVRVDLSRAARIKVRRYGSGYQMDKAETRHNVSGDFLRSIDTLRELSQRELSQQAEAPSTARVVLLIAFDKTATPLGGYIRDLNEWLEIEQSGIIFRTRCWKDRAKRGFGVRLAAWAYAPPRTLQD